MSSNLRSHVFLDINCDTVSLGQLKVHRLCYMNEIVWSCLSFQGHIYRLSNRRANIRGLRNPPPRRFQMAHGRKPQILARCEIRWNLFVRYGLEKTGMTSPYAGSVYFTPLGCIKAGPSGPGFLLVKQKNCRLEYLILLSYHRIGRTFDLLRISED